MDEWTMARRTGNADLLAGHLAALVEQKGGQFNYEIDRKVGLSNPLTIVNTMTGNRFNVTVEQVAGIE